MVPLAVVLIAGAVLGVGGRLAGRLAQHVTGHAIAAEAWMAFDALVVVAVALSYALTARYGIRFPRGGAADGLAGAVRVIVVQGNAAWRALPRRERRQHTKTVRALNASARLLLIDPSDEQAKAMLTQHAQTLRTLATSG
ncbi:hypothetical protein ACF08B_38915 [Streptomyces sp. NPDC015139]|uniref:hypothetical protein n=1 Tax=Streptomyces sp. NPDC015139 TaxID=3364942 RepID=UPI0036F707EE